METPRPESAGGTFTRPGTRADAGTKSWFEIGTFCRVKLGFFLANPDGLDISLKSIFLSVKMKLQLFRRSVTKSGDVDILGPWEELN